MRKTLFGIALSFFATTAAVAESGAFDVVINAEQFQYSPDMTQVTLTDATVSLKKQALETAGQDISAEELGSFWDPSDTSTPSFGPANPNATMSAWDKKKNFLESSFIITNVQNGGDKLTLTVQPIDKKQETVTVSINKQTATQKQLEQFTQRADKASVTILVDCFGGPFNGNCAVLHKHAKHSKSKTMHNHQHTH